MGGRYLQSERGFAEDEAAAENYEADAPEEELQSDYARSWRNGPRNVSHDLGNTSVEEAAEANSEEPPEKEFQTGFSEALNETPPWEEDSQPGSGFARNEHAAELDEANPLKEELASGFSGSSRNERQDPSHGLENPSEEEAAEFNGAELPVEDSQSELFVSSRNSNRANRPEEKSNSEFSGFSRNALQEATHGPGNASVGEAAGPSETNFRDEALQRYWKSYAENLCGMMPPDEELQTDYSYPHTSDNDPVSVPNNFIYTFQNAAVGPGSTLVGQDPQDEAMEPESSSRTNGESSDNDLMTVPDDFLHTFMCSAHYSGPLSVQDYLKHAFRNVTQGFGPTLTASQHQENTFESESSQKCRHLMCYVIVRRRLHVAEARHYIRADLSRKHANALLRSKYGVGGMTYAASCALKETLDEVHRLDEPDNGQFKLFKTTVEAIANQGIKQAFSTEVVDSR